MFTTENKFPTRSPTFYQLDLLPLPQLSNNAKTYGRGKKMNKAHVCRERQTNTQVKGANCVYTHTHAHVNKQAAPELGKHKNKYNI